MTTQTLNPISQGARACHKELTDKLVQAAADQHIRVDRTTLSIGILRSGAVVINSAVEGLANIDPIDYERGVPTNFVYTDVGGANLEAGFYTVTTYANWIKLGPIDTRMHYSQNGKLVAAIPGLAIVTSLRVPPEATPFVRTGLRIGTAFPTPVADWEEIDWEADPPTITYYTECSNGMYSCSDPEPIPVDG